MVWSIATEVRAMASKDEKTHGCSGGVGERAEGIWGRSRASDEAIFSHLVISLPLDGLRGLDEPGGSGQTNGTSRTVYSAETGSSPSAATASYLWGENLTDLLRTSSTLQHSSP